MNLGMRRKGGEFQFQQAEVLVSQALQSFAMRHHVIVPPHPREIWADLRQLIDKARDLFTGARPCRVGSEGADNKTRDALPIVLN
ncbi:hypothetical protein G6F21_014544 [Rhizopus arrhizus]|nr:hypothetical protein G6F21_014544 [Rhizopus arrhizus]